MDQNLLIIAVDLGGETAPVLMTYSEDLWPKRRVETPATTIERLPVEPPPAS